MLGHPCYKSVFDIPGDLDLVIILTGRAVDTFEAGAPTQGEVRGDLRGRLLGDGRGGQEARAAARRTRAVGRRTPARPEHEPQRVRGVPRRSRRPVDRADHAVGPPGPARVPGPGDRHPPHALGADRQRGRSRVRRLRASLRRSARGRRDRVLHRRLQGRPHLDARRRSRREAAQADGDGEGRQDRSGPVDGAVAHRSPHRFRRGHERGVPPVRRDPRRRSRRVARGLRRVRAYAAREGSRVGAPQVGPGRVRLRDLGRHRRAHGRHALRRRLAAPRCSPSRRRPRCTTD